jgi:DNA-binding Lrp family transcriptional regulator
MVALRTRAYPASPCRRRAFMRAIFVMIKCEMGQAYQVAQRAADEIEEMSEMHSISGQYDLLGKFYLDPSQDIGRFVTERLQTLPGVRDTYTVNAFTGEGRR